MKKILLASALLSAISTYAISALGVVYFKIDAGASMVGDLNSDGNYFAQKFEARNTPFINLGIGWNVRANVRTDFNFSYQFNNKFTHQVLTEAQYNVLNGTTNYPSLAIPYGIVRATPIVVTDEFISLIALPVFTGFEGTATRVTETALLNSKVNLATISGASVQDSLKDI